MDVKRYIKHIISLFLTLFLIITMLAPVFAENSGSISYEYAISDCKFSLYYVGDVNSSQYTLCDELSGYDIDMTDKNAADTLSAVVEYEGLEPIATGITDSDYNVSFNNLSKGVYLLVGEQKTVDNVRYTPEPVLVSVPSWIDDELTWNVPVIGKYLEEDLPEKTSISVVKAWKDDDNESRPTSVEVALLVDGKVDKTVTLDKSNNWKKEWKDLDSSHSYKVVEVNVPSGYTMSVKQNKTTFTITNTLKDTDTPSDDSSGTSDKLPQTGQLWWPVGVLTASGLLCILIGLLRRRKNED